MKRKTLGFLALSVSALLVLQTPATAMAGIWVAGAEEEIDESNQYEHPTGVVVDGSEEAEYDTPVGADNLVGDSEQLSTISQKLTVNGSVTTTNEKENAYNDYPPSVNAANGAEITITGNVSAQNANAVNATIYDDVEAASGGIVTVGGDVSSDKGSAASANGSGSSITINGDATTGNASIKNTVDASNGASITVDGNVTHSGDDLSATDYDGGSAVGAFDDGSVTVGGDVTSNSTKATAVSAVNNGTVDIKGNVSGVNGGINSNNSSKVNVDKGVSASSGVAINADISSTVTVGGDVSASSDVAINAHNSSTVTVGGNVTSGIFENGYAAPAITMDSTSTVVVKGNVETANKDIAEETAIIINPGSGSNGALIVLGDVTAHGEYGNAIWINTYNEENNTNDTFELDNLPDIVVGSLIADNKDLLVGFDYENENTTATNDELLESIYGNIMYYINIEQPKGGTINVTGGAEKYNDQYLVANEHGSVSFSVTPDEGYELDSVAGGKVDIIKNADGTYTVVVPRGGGIKISALLKAIEKVIPPSSEAPVIKVTSSKKSDDTPSTPVLTAAKSYSVFNNTIQKDITSVPQNGTLKIDMGNWISFNKKTFELLSKRSDVAITITYKYNGQTYKVTIPAGYPIMDLLDENGYCGCLYLNSIFGSELVTK